MGKKTAVVETVDTDSIIKSVFYKVPTYPMVSKNK